MNGWMQRWVIVGLALGLMGQVYAGEPPSFREMARVALHRWAWDEPQEANEMALSINTWLGGTGDFSAAGNWSHGHQPAGDDVGVFDGTSSTSVTTGLTATGTPFKQLLVKPAYRGQLGSIGDPLDIDIGNGPLVYRGSGQAFINGANGSNMQVVVNVDHSRANRFDLVLGGHGVGGGGGTVTTLAILRGRVHAWGDLNLNGQIIVQGSHSYLKTDPNLATYVEPLGMYCTGGVVEHNRTFQASRVLIVAGGAHVTQIAALPSTTYVVVVGGTFEYLPTSSPGTTPLLFALAGTYDQRNERFDHTWGTVITGIDALIQGGAVRGTGAWPPSLDLTEGYPGPQE